MQFGRLRKFVTITVLIGLTTNSLEAGWISPTVNARTPLKQSINLLIAPLGQPPGANGWSCGLTANPTELRAQSQTAQGYTETQLQNNLVAITLSVTFPAGSNFSYVISGNPPNPVAGNPDPINPIAVVGQLSPYQTPAVTFNAPFGPSSITYSAAITGDGVANCSVNVPVTCTNRQMIDTYATSQLPPNSPAVYAPYQPFFTTVDNKSTMVVPNNDPPFCTYTFCNDVNGAVITPDPSLLANCDTRRNGFGCFSAETRILLADGTLKKAADLRKGAELWNPIRKESVRISRLIVGPEEYPLIEFRMNQKHLVVSSQHPMRTLAGLKAAENVLVSDKLLLKDLHYYSIDEIKKLTPENPKPFVYNFQLDTSHLEADYHMLVAEGVVTGDYFLQQKLIKDNKKLP